MMRWKKSLRTTRKYLTYKEWKQDGMIRNYYIHINEVSTLPIRNGNENFDSERALATAAPVSTLPIRNGNP